MTDAYLDYSLLLLTSSLQLIGMELTPRPRKSAASDATPTPATFPGSLTTPKDDDGSTYTVSLSEPMFDKQGGLMALNGLPLQPQVILPPGVGSAKIVVTEENLKFLGQMVQGVRESLREVFTACDLAQLRCVLDIHIMPDRRYVSCRREKQTHTQSSHLYFSLLDWSHRRKSMIVNRMWCKRRMSTSQGRSAQKYKCRLTDWMLRLLGKAP